MENHHQDFFELFATAPTASAVAPGRVNLIGDHIDYLGGAVLPMAIEAHLEILTAPATDGFAFWSDALEAAPLRFDDLEPETAPERLWLNYPKGVLAGYHERGITPPPFQAAIYSAIPGGAGLSSSAALATACALAIEQLAGVELSVAERAKICQSAEHRYAGVPCGIMDQLAIGAGVEGCAVRIDCENLTTQAIHMPPNIAVVVADTGAKHSLADGQYAARRQDCEQALEILGKASFNEISPANLEQAKSQLDDRLYRRARHAVTEIARVDQFVNALGSGDFETLRSAMAASHQSLRDDFEVSCPELDCLVDAADNFGAQRGLVGARMTGGGFGGSTVNLVHRDAAPALIDRLRDAALAGYGGKITPFSTVPSSGAFCQSITNLESV